MARPCKSNTKRMSAETFAAVCQLVPNLSEHQVSVARAVLVEELTYQAAAERYGGTRQAAHKTTTTVWGVYERFKAAERVSQGFGDDPLPNGWECITINAPSELIEQIRRQLKTYQEKAATPFRGAPKKPRPADGDPG